MMVKIESLTFGGPFEAEVESGSVARGRVTLVGNGATYFWQPKSGKWVDIYATPEFNDIEYEITEVIPEVDPSKSTTNTNNEIAKDYEDFGLKELDATLGAMIDKLHALINNKKKVKPTALMDIIGNIPAGEWSKISGMANKEIKAACNVGLPPVNRAQVIRCLYAFERYARENGLIKPCTPLKLT